MQTIKIDDASKMFLRGDTVVIAEFRSYKCEDRTWRDKQTGRATTGTFLFHSVEIGSRACSFVERPPDGVTEANYQWPYSKGQRVLIRLDSMVTEKGHTSIRGTVVATIKD